MRADRLLSILLALQNNRMISAKKLAEKLEVSQRTVYRDIDALNFSGIPIYSTHGSHGGFSLDKDFHLNINGLTLKEIMSLLIRRSPGPLKDLGIKTQQQTINKLIETVPNSYRTETNQLIKRIYLVDAELGK